MEESNVEEDAKFKKKRRLMKIWIVILAIVIVIAWVKLILDIWINSNLVYQAKPIIYLYPEKDMRVTVKFIDDSKLTHTYPKYSSRGWEVLAKANGDLTDLNTGRSLYSLYWEGISDAKLDMTKGFVVEGKDTISFLEEKLKLLGLTEREANEFIIYWLPQMENNKYNFVYFSETEEMNLHMPIEVTPTPDTMIRILMKFKPLDKYIEVKEQEIITPERKGFVLVEWGGTKYE